MFLFLSACGMTTLGRPRYPAFNTARNTVSGNDGEPPLPAGWRAAFFADSSLRDDLKTQKTPFPFGERRFSCIAITPLSTATGRSAGTGLHARENESLLRIEIDTRIREHAFCPLFQKNLETVEIHGRVAHLGRFGYVHSQRRASAARDHEDSHPVPGITLLTDKFLEFVYSAVRQAYHYASLPYK
jgi:hypothetical protein